MNLKIKNASILPKRYYGLHFYPGTAEYAEPGKQAYKIFLNEETLRKMDVTFEGCPVFVQHVEEVDLKNLETEADGYVVKSFYNSADGKHWVEFMVVSDAGHEAIRKGWSLSNAYIPTMFGDGGQWNGQDYQKEIKNGKYEHLAIVPNPRYNESKILTPDQFKEYNERHALDLKRMANSKGDKPVFNIFKKAKVENSADFEGLCVTLPKSKLEVTLNALVEQADAIAERKGFASGDEKFQVGEEVLTVNEMAKKMCANKEDKAMDSNPKKENKGKKKNEDEADMDADEVDNEDDAEELEKAAEEKKNKAKGKKKNSADESGEEGDNGHFDRLDNADKTASESTVLHTDKGELGKQRYGSGK